MYIYPGLDTLSNITMIVLDNLYLNIDSMGYKLTIVCLLFTVFLLSYLYIIYNTRKIV